MRRLLRLRGAGRTVVPNVGTQKRSDAIDVAACVAHWCASVPVVCTPEDKSINENTLDKKYCFIFCVVGLSLNLLSCKNVS